MGVAKLGSGSGPSWGQSDVAKDTNSASLSQCARGATRSESIFQSAAVLTSMKLEQREMVLLTSMKLEQTGIDTTYCCVK